MPDVAATIPGGRVIDVEPGSALDTALRASEADGSVLEIAHGGRRYQLVPLKYDDEGDEVAWRRAFQARVLALRNAQNPLGITTAELIREARAENDGEQ